MNQQVMSANAQQRAGQAPELASTVGKYRWTICALLFFATTINYLDRQVLSLLAPLLTKEFGWSNTDYANITAVFQFVYAISMLFASAAGRSLKSAAICACDLKYCSGVKRRGRRESESV